MSDLRDKALAALQELVEQSTKAPVKRTLAIRFTLAFLANFADDRAPFDWFWQSLDSTDRFGRSQNARAALNGIRRAVSGK